MKDNLLFVHWKYREKKMPQPKDLLVFITFEVCELFNFSFSFQSAIACAIHYIRVECNKHSKAALSSMTNGNCHNTNDNNHHAVYFNEYILGCWGILQIPAADRGKNEQLSYHTNSEFQKNAPWCPNFFLSREKSSIHPESWGRGG